MVMEMEGGGRLKVWEEGERVLFRCEHPLRTDGIYKVWLRGAGGEQLLGTLMPENGMLLLCRVRNRRELRQCGFWPVQGARCARTFAFSNREGDGWYCENAPEELVDEETKKLGQWRPMMCRKGEKGAALACSLRGDVPLPLSHLFCFATPIQIRGEMHLVWYFDRKGRPYLPE